MKYVIVTILVALTGCASDTVVEDRLTSVESSVVKLSSELESCKTMKQPEQCTNHCNEFNTKLDQLHKKAMTK